MARTAVVTGGASGIGRRTVERLFADGWTVWAFDLSERGAIEQAPTLGAGRYRSQKCDVSDARSVKAAFDAVRRETGRLDALVCSAGVTITGSLEDHTPEEFDTMVGANFKGPWLTVREALPLLKKDASVTEPSRVVIVGSVSGIRPKVGSGIYGATKAAVHVLTGVYAVELAPHGILVNAVAPGSIDTPMLEAVAKANPASRFKPSGKSPLGRIGKPDDVVDAIEFFLGDLARYVNGVVLPVDGGSRAAFVST